MQFDIIEDEKKLLTRAQFCEILTAMVKDFDFKRIEPYNSQQVPFGEWLKSFRMFISF